MGTGARALPWFGGCCEYHILESGCKLSCVVEFLRWKLVNWVYDTTVLPAKTTKKWVKIYMTCTEGTGNKFVVLEALSLPSKKKSIPTQNGTENPNRFLNFEGGRVLIERNSQAIWRELFLNPGFLVRTLRTYQNSGYLCRLKNIWMLRLLMIRGICFNLRLRMFL